MHVHVQLEHLVNYKVALSLLRYRTGRDEFRISALFVVIHLKFTGLANTLLMYDYGGAHGFCFFFGRGGD